MEENGFSVWVEIGSSLPAAEIFSGVEIVESII